MSDDPVRPDPDGTVVTVWAVPGAKRTEVVGLHGDAVKVRVAAPPEAGKANTAIARLLQRTTEAIAVELLRGTTSRRKEFLLAGVTPAETRDRLGIAGP